MINDRTIDAKTAKFYCLFMDGEIAKALDNADKYDEKDGKRFAKVINMALKAKRKESINEVNWDLVQGAHQAAFPMATGNPFQPNFRALDPKSGVPSLQDQQKNNVIAGATAAAIAGASFIPGGWAALAGAFSAAGGWLTSAITAATTTLGISGIMSIIAGLVTVSSYLYPRLAKVIKDFTRNGIIAQCKFEADGTPYKAVFSISNKRWELLYDNNRWLRSGTLVPTNDIQTFFESKFFDRFLKQCDKYLAIYNDQVKMEQLQVLEKIADKSSKKDIRRLIDAKSVIHDYMLTGQYITESLMPM